MASVLEMYKAKKAAELAKGGAAPQINAPEAEQKLATVTQAEVDGAKQSGPDPLTGAGSASTVAAPVGEQTTPNPAASAGELTRGQKAAATRAARKLASTNPAPDGDPGFVFVADASDRELVAELFSRGYGVTKL